MLKYINILLLGVLLIFQNPVSFAQNQNYSEAPNLLQVLRSAEKHYKCILHWEIYSVSEDDVSYLAAKTLTSSPVAPSIDDFFQNLSLECKNLSWYKVNSSYVIKLYSKDAKIVNLLDRVIPNVSFSGSVGGLVCYIRTLLPEVYLVYFSSTLGRKFADNKVKISGGNVTVRQLLTVACNQAGLSWNFHIVDRGYSKISFRRINSNQQNWHN